MKELNNEIDLISIYLNHPEKDDEKIGQVTFTSPFSQKKKGKIPFPTTNRKLSFFCNLHWLRKIILNMQVIAFKKFSSLAPKERKTKEAKFKTCLALLLNQEMIRELLFRDKVQSEAFFSSIEKVAQTLGINNLILPSPTEKPNPLQISRELTWLNGRGGSLIDDLPELNLQMALLKKKERDELLFNILNNLKRPPVISTIHIARKEKTNVFEATLVTKFVKYHVTKIEKETQEILFQYVKDEATSGIKTLANLQKNAFGVANQRLVYAKNEKGEEKFIGSYCGELVTKYHVIEQILCIFEGNIIKNEAQFFLHNYTPDNEQIEEVGVLFTSLFSWNEMEKVTRQYYAIRSINGAILKLINKEGQTLFYRLNLYYYNIPFNTLGKLPLADETKGVMQDLNDETTILLGFQALQLIRNDLKSNDGALTKIDEVLSELAPLEKAMRILRSPITAKETEIDDGLLYSKNRMIDLIDAYRAKKKKWIPLLQEAAASADGEEKQILLSVIALFRKKSNEHKGLNGADMAIYLSYLANKLFLLRSTNCDRSIDRTAGALAADKAQYIFSYLSHHPFLPGFAHPEQEELFKLLYTLYLVWEEPEITSGFSSGHTGELFYRYSLKKSSETTRYLMNQLLTY